MIRLFQVYYPVRTIALLVGELAILIASFTTAAVILLGPDAEIVLRYENGLGRVCLFACAIILAAYYLDLYSPQKLTSSSETYFRLCMLLGSASTIMAVATYFDPTLMLAPGVLTIGITLSSLFLLVWRALYARLLRMPMLREQVYVLGSGEIAARLVEAIRQRSDLGVDIVGWAGANRGIESFEEFSATIERIKEKSVPRVIIAMTERRGTLPVRELLELRLHGVTIEDSIAVLEKITGKLPIDYLQPSGMIFSDGFCVNEGMYMLRPALSVIFALAVATLVLPLIPFVVLAVKLSSPGPILFSQQRVGRYSKVFRLYKFRTMCADAESQSGAVWAQQNDPRITVVGKFLRKTRLDEFPQLWNVIKGDMAFVGPRPERPEFVKWLNDAIPYYNLRHMVRPGLTGWAQVRFRYGASLEETKQKLEYDLYYIKHISVPLDLLIIFETVKTVILRRGAN
jgi:sugar transferase (PEP-CTERM system associated)